MLSDNPIVQSIENNFIGFGLGLRTDHFHDVLNTRPDIDWFEVVSENFMVAGGKPRYYLDAIREHYPIVMHGVSLSIGSTDGINWTYLNQLKKLASDTLPLWISDHLCWTGVDGVNSHDLLPLPYTEEAVAHVVKQIQQVQDFLGRQILIENVSSYLSYKTSEMQEWEFLNVIAQQADCKILLDINNIYVSSRNHDFDCDDYLVGIDPARVQQFHLAGHSDFGDYVVDTHDHPVCDPVWSLYQKALQRFGPVSTMIERDANIPSFKELEAELDIARDIAQTVFPDIGVESKKLIS